MMSKAQLSEATHQRVAELARATAAARRTGRGRRRPRAWSSPRSSRRPRAAASPRRPPFSIGRASSTDSSAAMISESDVPRKVMPSLAQLVVELDRVGQVAVVGERHLAAVVAPDRLRVLPRAAAGGRVADVADRHVAVERAQLLLVEDLRDEPRVAQRGDVPALAGRDPRRLLAAVLERVQGEVREPGDVVPRRVDAEDAALVARAVAVIKGSGSRSVGRAAESSSLRLLCDPRSRGEAGERLPDKASSEVGSQPRGPPTQPPTSTAPITPTRPTMIPPPTRSRVRRRVASSACNSPRRPPISVRSSVAGRPSPSAAPPAARGCRRRRARTRRPPVARGRRVVDPSTRPAP